MIRGLYAAASGLGVQQARMENAANNLANTGVNGFKKDTVIVRPFSAMLLQEWEKSIYPAGGRWRPVGVADQGATVTQAITDWQNGPLKMTGRDGDLALTAEGCFFTVQAPGEGNGVLFTRDGSFTVDRDGYLVDGNGYRLLGERGPVWVGNNRFRVDERGLVYVEGREPQLLDIREFRDLSALVKVGNRYFSSRGKAGQRATNPGVRQGYLEGANIDLAAGAAELLTCIRAYEANQKVVQAHDELLNQLISQVGATH